MSSNKKNADKSPHRESNDFKITYKKPEGSLSTTSTSPSICPPPTGDMFPTIEDYISTTEEKINPENDHHFNLESIPGKSDGMAFSDSLLALPSLQTILEDCEGESSSRPVPKEDMENPIHVTNGFPVENLSITNSRDFTQTPEINNNRGNSVHNMEKLKKESCWFHTVNDKDTTEKVLLWPEADKKLREHASYLFHKDNRPEIRRIADLMPKGREFVMFNIFHDIAKAFGKRTKRKQKEVQFQEEFLQKYEEQGDVAGKDRFVPETPAPFKTPAKPKRKLSAVYSTWSVKSNEFLPRVERIDDTTKCEVLCQRGIDQLNCCNSSKKPDLTVTINGFISNLNLISLFISAHATRTFQNAMMILEFVRFHDDIGSDTFIKRNSTVWRMNYAKQHFGVLSGSIWILTFCIRTLIINETKNPLDNVTRAKLTPSELGFRTILEEFAAFCLIISENFKSILQYSQNFHNFCKECERLIQILKYHLEFEVTLKYSKPLRRGDGLELNRALSKAVLAKQPSVEVLIKKAKKRSLEKQPDNLEPPEEMHPEWKRFSECTGAEKVSCLKQLLVLVNSGMTTVQTQLRFLMDDIAESAKDVSAQSDLLYLLADMLDRVKYLESFGRKNVKQELETCATNMNDLCKDFQEFINYGEHIIKRFIELRDVTHLCYEFMVNGLKIQTLEDMVPQSTFRKKRNLHSRKKDALKTQTGDVGKKSKNVADNYHPKYKPIDFYRTFYHDMVSCRAEITTLKYHFQINGSKDHIQDFVPTLKDLHLQYWSDPKNYLSKIASIEEIDNIETTDNSDTDEDDPATGDEMELRPIIKVISPRGSADLTAEREENPTSKDTKAKERR